MALNGVSNHKIRDATVKKNMLAVLCMSIAGLAGAQTPAVVPDPVATDPTTLGWMQGFPPAADKTIRFGNGSYYQFPRTRWSFSHIRELTPTVGVWRGTGAVSVLPVNPVDLNAISFLDDKGQRATWADMLTRTYTDSIIVMHKGAIIYEKYFGAAQAQYPHTGFSVTKSFIGTLAALLVAAGALDPSALVSKYIPELAASAYGDATVRQVMDMTIGVQFSENYADPKAEVFDYARAGGMLPVGANYAGPKSFYEFLVELKKQGQHGERFAYKTANAEVLSWIVKRASGKSVAALLSEKIWQKLGAENDAYFQVDPVGSESGGGGLNLPVRDMARFGEMMRLDGRFNGQQIIPKAVIDDIKKGGDPAKYAKAGLPDMPGYGAGYAYRNMWWVSNNAHGVFDARGIHGQRIYIDPKAEMVIVKFSSHPVAANTANIPLTDRAFAAVADVLMK